MLNRCAQTAQRRVCARPAVLLCLKCLPRTGATVKPARQTCHVVTAVWNTRPQLQMSVQAQTHHWQLISVGDKAQICCRLYCFNLKKSKPCIVWQGHSITCSICSSVCIHVQLPCVSSPMPSSCFSFCVKLRRICEQDF